MQQCLIPTALKPSNISHLWCHLRLSSCKCKCMCKCIFALIYVRVYKTINDPVAYRVQSAHFVFIFSWRRLPTLADLYYLCQINSTLSKCWQLNSFFFIWSKSYIGHHLFHQFSCESIVSFGCKQLLVDQTNQSRKNLFQANDKNFCIFIRHGWVGGKWERCGGRERESWRNLATSFFEISKSF